MRPAPLDDIEAILPPNVLTVVTRETPIPSIAQRAAEVQAERPDLVRGDIGQIIGVDGVEDVLYGPPNGLPALREAIARTWNHAFSLAGGRLEGLPDGLTMANVAVCTGASEGLSLSFRCFAHKKRVGLPHGHWENYTNGIDLAGGQSALVRFFDDEGALDIDGIANTIRAENLDLLVTNFPSNPTGAVLDADDYERLGRVIREAGIIVLADEVYARLRYDGIAPETLMAHAPGHVISVSAASKEYLLPGARVGYLVSARADVTDRVMRRMIRANTASPNVLGQRRLLAFLERDLEDIDAGRAPRFLASLREELSRRRDRLLLVLARHGLEPVGRAGHHSEGTIFLMASLPPWWSEDDTAFASRALEAGLFSCIPGSAFGLTDCVRFSFGAMTSELIERLDHALSAFENDVRS